MPYFRNSFIVTISSSLYLRVCDTVADAPAKPFDALQDSELFDAENSETLPSSGGRRSPGQDWRQNERVLAQQPGSPERRQRNGSTQRHRVRGTDAAILYGVK